MVFRQCCVCKRPAAPADALVTHGYHDACFRAHHALDFTPEEMDEVLVGNTMDEEEVTAIKVAVSTEVW